MKLRNKLIPILSAATVAATVAPATLTSCSSGMVNLINGYNPSIKKAVWEDYKSNRDDMLAFYASAVNENPEIFVQDMYWKHATEQLYVMDYAQTQDISTTPKTFEAKVSNVQIKKLTCFYTDEETQTRKSIDYYTISMDFTMHLAYHQVDGNEYGNKANIDSESTTTFSVKNIPFSINDDSIKGIEWFDYYFGGWSTNVEYIAQLAKKCFYYGFLPTDWVVRPLAYMYYDDNDDEQLEHKAFTLLEQNGYEWSIKYNYVDSTTYTYFDTAKDPETETSNVNLLFDHDSQFEKALADWKDYSREEASLELYMAKKITNWFLPSYYLSDIVDPTIQLHKHMY